MRIVLLVLFGGLLVGLFRPSARSVGGLRERRKNRRVLSVEEAVRRGFA